MFFNFGFQMDVCCICNFFMFFVCFDIKCIYFFVIVEVVFFVIFLKCNFLILVINVWIVLLNF